MNQAPDDAPTERVVPPPPPAPTTSPRPSVELAPPLGAPSASHTGPPAPPYSTPPTPAPQYPTPAPQYPPYAQNSPAPYPTAQYPPAQYSTAQYPISSASAAPLPSQSPRWIPVLVISVIGALAVLAFLVVAFLAASNRPSADPRIPPAPSAPSAPPHETPSPDSSDAPASGATAEGIQALLDAKIEEYRLARDNGTLWTRIPDNEYNRTAVTAFLYLLTDMSVATIWGVDDETAAEHAAESARLEELLLAQKPLGTDIEITMEEGRVFRYDGETGEGGFFEE